MSTHRGTEEGVGGGVPGPVRVVGQGVSIRGSEDGIPGTDVILVDKYKFNSCKVRVR